MKNLQSLNNFKASQQLRRGGGFAMVLALVVMTVMFVVVGSLSTTRQMWGFFSTKQLDKSNLEFPARADSENWFRLTRESLLINGVVNAPQHLGAAPSDGSIDSAAGNTASTVIYFHQDGQEPFPAVILDGALEDYPSYGDNSVSFGLPISYEIGTNPVTSEAVGPYDPYWGMTRYGGSYAVLFKREMPEDIRQIRVDRFNNQTQLRAWMSIDAGLITRLRYRTMPMSAFTYYFVTTDGATNNPVAITTNFISPLNVPYNHNGYEVNSVGMGRIYVDGVINFNTSGITNNPVLGFPVVATRGVRNLGTTTLHIPSFYDVDGGGTIVTNLNATNYWVNRYLALKGMILTSAESPQKLITRFANNVPPFNSKAFAAGILSEYNSTSQTAVRVTLDTSTNTNVLAFGGANTNLFVSTAGQIQSLLSTNNPGMWSVDHSNRVVTLRPSLNYFTNFVLPPTSIHFSFNGTNADLYKLRLDVPSLNALGVTDAQRRLSIVTSNTVVVGAGGFNSDNSGQGAMILSPRIEIDSSNTVNLGAYIVTRGVVGNALRPLYPMDTNTPTNVIHRITGGLSYTANTSFIPPRTLGVQIVPSVGYLQGTIVPPAVPAVFDYRIAGQDLEVYQMIPVAN